MINYLCQRVEPRWKLPTNKSENFGFMAAEWEAAGDNRWMIGR